jgi:protocatechuate 3,4-dioxygenase beta subunit
MYEEDDVKFYGGYGPQPAPAGLVVPAVGPLAQAGALAATPECADHDDPTPRAIEGPFYKRFSPRRFDLREPCESGQLVELSGRVLTRSGRPVSAANIDLWHADRAGDYDNAGYRYRGNIVTNADGRYKFLTIKPGAYGDWDAGTARTVHYHLIVRAPSIWTFTTQLYFPGEPDNMRDDYFRRDLMMAIAPPQDGMLAAKFDIVLETFRNP